MSSDPYLAFGFTRLSSKVYYLPAPPSPSSTTEFRPSTQTIVLCTWTNAPSKPILKYVSLHRSLSPTARIILLPCWTSTYTNPSILIQSALKPAVSLLYTASISANSHIYIHCLSHGGLLTFAHLLQLYHKTYSQCLRTSAMLLESCPAGGVFPDKWIKCHRAFTTSTSTTPPSPIKWLVGWTAAWLAIIWTFTTPKLIGADDFVDWPRKVLNDAEYVSRDGVRVYVYGERDDMVLVPAVESHAQEARGLGIEVEMLKRDTGHLGFLREKDGREHIEVIREIWRKGIRARL